MADAKGDGPGCGCVAILLVAAYLFGHAAGTDAERKKASDAGVGRWVRGGQGGDSSTGRRCRANQRGASNGGND